MDIEQLIAGFSGASIIHLFIKSFSIVFSFIYFFYAVIITKQTKTLTNTLTVQRINLIITISFIQIIIGIILIVYSLFII